MRFIFCLHSLYVLFCFFFVALSLPPSTQAKGSWTFKLVNDKYNKTTSWPLPPAPAGSAYNAKTQKKKKERKRNKTKVMPTILESFFAMTFVSPPPSLSLLLRTLTYQFRLRLSSSCSQLTPVNGGQQGSGPLGKAVDTFWGAT